MIRKIQNISVLVGLNLILVWPMASEAATTYYRKCTTTELTKGYCVQKTSGGSYTCSCFTLSSMVGNIELKGGDPHINVTINPPNTNDPLDLALDATAAYTLCRNGGQDPGVPNGYNIVKVPRSANLYPIEVEADADIDLGSNKKQALREWKATDGTFGAFNKAILDDACNKKNNGGNWTSVDSAFSKIKFTETRLLNNGDTLELSGVCTLLTIPTYNNDPQDLGFNSGDYGQCVNTSP